MKENIKTALKWALGVLPIGVVGGFLTALYTYDHLQQEVLALLLETLGNKSAFLALVTAQSTIYACIATFLGYLLANACGLIKPFRFEKNIVVRVAGISAILGIIFAGDYFTFGKLIPEVAANYEVGISPAYFFSSLIYGGIVEELMLRLFAMSLVCFILWKVFARSYKKDEIPSWVFVTANIIAASLFAAGHLPATAQMFGAITPVILFRCFLLNGGFALFFGRFYRKYGIQYAMVSHMILHLVDKLILLLVI